jgi:hypothetical protein
MALMSAAMIFLGDGFRHRQGRMGRFNEEEV